MIVARNKSEQNESWIDPWTVVHFGFGLAAGLVNIPFTIAIIGAAGYEIFEQAMERSEWGQEFFQTSGPERPGNVVVDVAIFAVGHVLGTAWNRS